MSGQVDVGWSSPPFGLDALDQAQIRIVARANDLPEIRSQTVRTLITHARTLGEKKETIDRFMKAYRETIDYMYADPEAIRRYADFAGISEAAAGRIRTEFFPKSLIDPDRVAGLDLVMRDAISFRTIAALLNEDQQRQLVQIPPR